MAIALATQTPSFARTFAWNLDANGEWERRANWSPIGVPDSMSDDAVFGRAITRPRTVTITAPTGVDVQSISLDSPHAYTIDSTGRVLGLNLTTAGRVAAIDVLRGSHELAAIVHFLDAVNLDVAAGAQLEFSNIVGFNGHAATTTGDGEYRFNSSGAVAGVSGSLVGQAGTISGIGTIGANLQNTSATVAPGTAVPGILTVAGNYVQAAGGRTRLRVGGSPPATSDRLHVFGAVTLGGELDIEFVNGFTPQLNQTIPLISAQRGVGGMFQTVSFSTSPGRFAAEFFASASGMQLRFVQPDTSNQLGTSTLLANWFNPASWTGGMVPDSTNVVALRNTIVRDQRVFIPGSASALVHDLSIQGNGANTMSLEIQGGNLSASHQVSISPRGVLQLGGGNLATSRVRVEGGGLFSGNGQVIGDFVLGTGDAGEAVLSPGTQAAPVGVLQIEGDYQQASNGVLKIDILGTGNGQWDALEVLGEASLGGILRVDVSNLSTLAAGLSFEIIGAGSLEPGARFDAVETIGGDGIHFEPDYLPDAFTISSYGPGDMDLSGDVKPPDIPLFALALVDPVAYSQSPSASGTCICNRPFFAGNVNQDAFFDFDDIEAFAALLGVPVSQVVAAIPGVPEPPSIWLLVIACMGLASIGAARGRCRSRYQQAAARSGFTLAELLVVIAIIGVLLAILLPAVQAAREAARRAACTNHLKQLGLALLNYHDQHSAFPPGAHLHERMNQASVGWRVLILPYMEESALYDEIRPLADGGAAHWDPSERAVESLLCPSGPREGPVIGQLSHFAGISGAYRGESRIDLEDSFCGDIYTNGILYLQSRTKIADVSDGTSHTLIVGERLYVFRNWMAGATQLTPTTICSGASKNIRFPINADPTRFGYFPGDPEAPPEADRGMLLNDLYFGSGHSGGAQFAYADGSVHFLRDDMDFTVYQDLATRDGGEVAARE
jgi:prepilin-type N-terminal cleavage/methylation domain-containing protein/prepilin-type processing-associated H-X9-DG protein